MADPFFKDLAFAALAQTARNPTRDFLQATPRNPILGYLSDLAASSYSPERTQQMQGVAKFMSAPAISETLDRLSYGEPLTTGAGGLGGTTRIRPEALEAAMAVAPMVVPALNMIRPAVKAGARALGPTAVSMGEGYLQRRGLMPELDVYHGSPHKFDRFDASKIGTGEGAQAYGHGIYTAENPGIAQGYADRLGGGQFGSTSAAKGSTADRLSAMFDNDGSNFKKGSRDISIIAKNLAEKTKVDANGLVHHQFKDGSEWIGSQSGWDVANTEKNLYKVDLPDEQIAKMLDYDKPMSEQSDEVKNILLPYQKEIGGSFGTGEQTLKAIAFERRMKGLDDSPAAVSQQLRDMGIPGIKYLDATSRGTGQGTRNFVTFPGEEQSLTILERNNQPVQQAMNEFEQSLINFMATPAK